MTLHSEVEQVQVRLSNLDYQRGSGGEAYVGADSLDKQKRARDCASLNLQWRKENHV